MTRLDTFVFLLLFGSFAFFQHSEPGWNVNSRFALALAWAETGSPAVERYVARPGLQTEDLAAYSGHLYSDKSIGTSLLAVPAVWAVKGIEAIADTTFATDTRRWLVTVLSVGLSGALAGVLLMRWLAIIWAPPRSNDATEDKSGNVPDLLSAFVAVGVILGSMLFLYGTLLMSYLPATACLVASLICIERAAMDLRPPQTTDPRPSRRREIYVFFAGLTGGLAVLCEYTYAAAVGLMGLYLLAKMWQQQNPDNTVASTHSPRPSLLLSALCYGLGAIIGIAPFLIYTISIFGKPAVPYEYHVMPQFREAMARGFMGAGLPDFHVLWLITFHPFRGIFFYSPLLLLGFLGLFWMALRHQGRRSLALLCITSSVFYLLFNAAYYMWWGGWSFSPRHLAPAIPFMAAGVLPWLKRLWSRWVLIGSTLFGAVIHTLVNATEPQPPDGGWQEALLQPSLVIYDYPGIFLNNTWRRITDGAFDANVASLIGLTGFASLTVLLAWWLLWGIAVLKLKSK